MASSQDIVIRAMRRLQVIDINEQPTAAETTHGLAVLSEMINAWARDLPALAVRTMAATVTLNDATVEVEDTSLLADGLNVSGVGIPAGAYITEVTDATHFELSAAATAGGTAVTLTVTPIPFPVRHEGGVAALLAVRLAGDFGLPDAPARVVSDAEDGWNGLLADYMPTIAAIYDPALTHTTGRFWSNDTDILF